MNDIRQRLIHCFGLVFPAIPPDSLPALAQEQTPAWDSLASVNLLTLVCDEFELTLDYEQIENLTSFERIHDYLATLLRA